MTTTLLVAPYPVPGECDDATDRDPSPRSVATFSDRDHFPAPRGRVVATRPPAGAPTLWDVVADYMADEWEEGT